MGILMESNPANAVDDVRMARKLYKAVCELFDASPETPIQRIAMTLTHEQHGGLRSLTHLPSKRCAPF